MCHKFSGNVLVKPDSKAAAGSSLGPRPVLAGVQADAARDDRALVRGVLGAERIERILTACDAQAGAYGERCVDPLVVAADLHVQVAAVPEHQPVRRAADAGERSLVAIVAGRLELHSHAMLPHDRTPIGGPQDALVAAEQRGDAAAAHEAQVVPEVLPDVLKTKARTVRATRPVRIVEEAIQGMLPKSKLGKQMYRKLQVYAGDKHPHQAQKPVEMAVS